MELGGLLAREIGYLFCFLLLGSALGKGGLFSPEDSRVLSVFAVYLLSPCAIVSAFQIDYTPERLRGFCLAVFSVLAVHGLFLLLARAQKGPLALTGVERASIIYSNAGNLILPLAAAVLGQGWVFYASAYMVAQAFFLWTHGRYLVCGTGKGALRDIFCNVNILAVFLGAVLFVTGLRLPGRLATTAAQLGAVLGPVCMLVAGILISRATFRAIFKNRRAWMVCAQWLVLFPLAVIVLIRLTGAVRLHPDARQIFLVVLMAAAAPSASAITQLAQLGRRESEYASVINALSILLCIVTMPLMIGLYELLV